MLKLKTFQKLLNGGGALAGSAGLADEIEKLRRERAVLCAELAGFPAQRAAAIEADDFRDRKRALAEREEQIYDDIERIDHQIERLQTRLLEVGGQERELLWRELRRQHDEAAAGFVTAMRATREAMRAVVALREKALAAGFEAQVAAAFPFVPALGTDGCVVSGETIGIFQNGLDRAHGASITTLSVTPPRPAPRPSAPVAVGAEHGVGAEDARGRSADRVPDRPAAPPVTPPVVVPRESQTFGEPGEGMVKVEVFRPGYEAPGGEQCRRGDFVWLHEETARIAVTRGAVNYLQGEAQ